MPEQRSAPLAPPASQDKLPGVLSMTDFVGWRFGVLAKVYVVLLVLLNMSIGAPICRALRQSRLLLFGQPVLRPPALPCSRLPLTMMTF